MPIGPRAWNLFVEIATSPPNPNSPPSLYLVEAFKKTAEASTTLKNFSPVDSFSVIIASECPVPYFSICFKALSKESTIFTLTIKSKNSCPKSLLFA